MTDGNSGNHQISTKFSHDVDNSYMKTLDTKEIGIIDQILNKSLISNYSNLIYSMATRDVIEMI